MIMKYCLPPLLVMGKRPVRSVWRKSDAGMTLVMHVTVLDRLGSVVGYTSSGDSSLGVGRGNLALVLRLPCMYWSICPFGVAVVTGGCRVIISAVRPGSDTHPLLTAWVNEDMAGEHMTAW